MTKIESRLCACKFNKTDTGMRQSPKKLDLTFVENHPTSTNLEKHSQCSCTVEKCKMTQLLRLCKENPDWIIGVYRVSKSEDKCLPDIDLDARPVSDSSDKLTETSGKSKYHYLMTDQSTSYTPMDNEELHTEAAETPSKCSLPSEKLKIEDQDEKLDGECSANDTDTSTKDTKKVPKSILHKTNTIMNLDNSSNVSKDDSKNADASEDKTKNVMIDHKEKPSHPSDWNISITNHESSHILSLLNFVMKKQKESPQTTMDIQTDKKIKKTCLSLLKCFLCTKKNERKVSYFDQIGPRYSSDNNSTD
ncbi:uncharacterized protein [Leptinotarsa decemlineata]|uniref:uncharacterized protein n=1 Tax=Leptinotarsa decemlineata TaxID=7539 RepID=UPI003D30C59B